MPGLKDTRSPRAHGNQDNDFMVDTRAELSVVTKPVTPLSKRTAAVTGVLGEEMVKSFCQPRKCQMGGHQVIHEFLYIPECPVPLLGRDLLSKLGAQVTFPPEERPIFQVGTTTYLLSLPVPLKMNGGYMSPLEINKTRQQSWREGWLSCSLRSGPKITPLG